MIRISSDAPTIHIVVITVWEAKHYTIFVLRRHWAGRNRKLVPAPRFMGPSKRKRIPRNFHTPPFPGLCRVFGENRPPPPTAEECSRFTERADALKAERKEVSRQVEKFRRRYHFRDSPLRSGLWALSLLGK